MHDIEVRLTQGSKKELLGRLDPCFFFKFVAAYCARIIFFQSHASTENEIKSSAEYISFSLVNVIKLGYIYFIYSFCSKIE